MDGQPNPQQPQPFVALLETADVFIAGIGINTDNAALLIPLLESIAPSMNMIYMLAATAPLDATDLKALQQACSVPLTLLTTGISLQRNHVYLIMPPYECVAIATTLAMVTQHQDAYAAMPLDNLFRALAVCCGRMAGAVVMQGQGTDGLIGLQWIHDHGGVIVVQDPIASDTPIPTAALELADFRVALEEIVPTLHSYWQQPGLDPRHQLLRLSDDALPQTTAEQLEDVFGLLKGRTGHDFTHYKRATIMRRIARRIAVHEVENLGRYVEILRTQPDEIMLLLRDLLISVTQFFRDPDHWAALQARLPALFEAHDRQTTIRVWVAGCATGEEAYTITMLLCEYASTLDNPPSIQVFATDIDEAAIKVARQGLYPASIAADIAPERLQRFFTLDHGSYRIKKEVRDMILFAPQNILRDPPFSRLDIITCRNILIYLNRQIQEYVLNMLHFVLQPHGILMLGASESTDGVQGLFNVLDKQHRLFQRRIGGSVTLPMLPLMRQPARPAALAPIQYPEIEAPSWPDLHAKLINTYIPASVIVNEHYDIVHVANGGGHFLQFGDGQPTHNILKLIDPDLRIELRTALFAAQQRDHGPEVRRVHKAVHGAMQLVVLSVEALREPTWAHGCMLVVVQEYESGSDHGELQPLPTVPLVHQLDDELQRTREEVRTTVEQYETAVEEYKAANEELQAINEELRAASEELETSQEELQSANEELITVNQELKHHVEVISQTNNDLQNLMASTDIATIFIDRQLRIKRYTPSAQLIFNLLPTDIDRPLAHLTHQLVYARLQQDAEQVLLRVAVVTREISSTDGRWFLARFLPYRTAEDRIDGVILTFIDITERKATELRLLAREQQLSAIVQYMPAGLLIVDPDGIPLMSNLHARRILDLPGTTSDDERAATPALHALLHPLITSILATVLTDQQIGTGQTFLLTRPDADDILLQINAGPFYNADQTIHGIVLAFEDITNQAQTESRLNRSEAWLNLTLHLVGSSMWDWTPATDTLLICGDISLWSTAQESSLSLDRQQFLQPVLPAHQERINALLTTSLTTSQYVQEEIEYVHADGSRQWMLVRGRRLPDQDGQPAHVVGITQDISVLKHSEALLRQAHDEQEARVQERTRTLTQTVIRLKNEGAERMRVQQALNQSYHRTNDILESISDAFYTVDAQWRFTYINRTAEKLWGRKRETLEGLVLWDEFPALAGNAEQRYYATAMDQRSGVEFESLSPIFQRWINIKVCPNDYGLTVYFHDIHDRKLLENNRQNLMRLLVQGQEQERRRIARELHDHLAQELTGLSLRLNALHGTLHATPAQAQIEAVQKQVQTLNHAVHRLALELRPSVLDDLGLEAALRSAAEHWMQATSLRIDVHVQALLQGRLPELLETTIYRVTQEALTNIARHAQATEASIIVTMNNTAVSVIVEDNGIGLDEATLLASAGPNQRLGIRGMHERVELVDGTITIESGSTGGTTVFIHIPWLATDEAQVQPPGAAAAEV